MTAHLPVPPAHAQTAHAAPPPARDDGYVLIPQRLLMDLRDSALAPALYGLIARLFLVHHVPVPLSDADILRFDPSLRRGAVRRALQRLCQAGWLQADVISGHKACYRPTWGLINNTPSGWDLDRPRLGCPSHVHTLRLDRRLLDVYLGRLDPHRVHPAQITRYTSAPLLGLQDVTGYALTQIGVPTPTPSLVAWGLVCHNVVQPLPPTEVILARASQLTLTAANGVLLAPAGFARLGLTDASRPSPPEQPLVFVPPAAYKGMAGEVIGTMIGGVIGGVIGTMIGSPTITDAPVSACQCPRTPRAAPAPVEAGNQGNLASISEDSDSSSSCTPVITAPLQEEGTDERFKQLLRAEGFAPQLIRRFQSLNIAAACASIHQLAAEGCGVGAIVQRWRDQPPVADAADLLAVQVAPADFTPSLIATLASYLRDGLEPAEACAASRTWAATTSRAVQEQHCARENKNARPAPRRLCWRDDAPRRTEGGVHEGGAGRAEALTWTHQIAPPDFTEPMRNTLVEQYLEGIRDPADAVASAREWHRRLALRGRTGGGYA